MTAQNNPQTKDPGEFRRIAAGLGVSTLTAVMLIPGGFPFEAV